MRLRGALAVVLVASAAAPVAARASEPPPISAPAAIVVEASSGDVAYAKDADDRRAVASLTKLMTALVVRERTSLRERLVAPAYDGDPVESTIELSSGERLTVRDLLRGLLLASGNDAAATLADGVSGSRAGFVRLMNRDARRFGLDDTRFANPIGLDDPDNYSTARDLARLAVVLRRDPFLRRTVALPRATLRSGDRTREIDNRNTLVGSAPRVDGVKTGHTRDAGYCLVGSATRGGVTVVSVVLGATSEAARDDDTRTLLSWGLRRFEVVRPVVRGRALARAEVRLSGGRSVPLVAARGVRAIVPRGARVEQRVSAPRELEGPLARGRRVGTVVASAGGDVLGRVPLLTGADVPAPSTVERVKQALDDPLAIAGLVAIILAGAGSLLVVIARRRARGRERRRSRRRTVA